MIDWIHIKIFQNLRFHILLPGWLKKTQVKYFLKEDFDGSRKIIIKYSKTNKTYISEAVARKCSVQILFRTKSEMEPFVNWVYTLTK